MNQSQLSKRKKSYLNSVKPLKYSFKFWYKVIYRYKISFFVFDIIEIEYEFDFSTFSEMNMNKHMG